MMQMAQKQLGDVETLLVQMNNNDQEKTGFSEHRPQPSTNKVQ